MIAVVQCTCGRSRCQRRRASCCREGCGTAPASAATYTALLDNGLCGRFQQSDTASQGSRESTPCTYSCEDADKACTAAHQRSRPGALPREGLFVSARTPISMLRRYQQADERKDAHDVRSAALMMRAALTCRSPRDPVTCDACRWAIRPPWRRGHRKSVSRAACKPSRCPSRLRSGDAHWR